MGYIVTELTIRMCGVVIKGACVCGHICVCLSNYTMFLLYLLPFVATEVSIGQSHFVCIVKLAWFWVCGL